MNSEMDSSTRLEDCSGNERTEDFFNEMEIATKVTIPKELKNMLKFNGLLSDGLLSRMTDADLDNMEEFARNQLHQLIQDSDLENYYGVFKRDPSKFKFLVGHRKTFHLIVDFFKKKMKDESQTSVNIKKPYEQLKQKTSQKTKVTKIIEHTTDHSDLKNEDSLQTDLDQLEEKKIFNIIRNWIQGKVDKNKWESLKPQLGEITLKLSDDGTGEKCLIKCFCGIIISISKFGNKKGRWIYSNFHSHMSKHLNDKTSDPGRNDKRKRQTNLLTNFVSISNEMKRKKSTINILENKIINTSNSEGFGFEHSIEDAVPCAEHREVHSEPHFRTFQMSARMPEPKEEIEEEIDLEIDLHENVTENEANTAAVYNEENPRKNVEKQSKEVSQETLEETSKETEHRAEHNLEEVGVLSETNITKWKSVKYQRSERLNRRREQLSQKDQMKITDYFEIINEISETLNKMDCEASHNFLTRIKISGQHDEEENVTNNFLRKLLTIAKENSKNKRNEYSDYIKKVGIYLFRTGGRLLYETLQANLQNILPSISSLNRFSKANNEKLMTEASFDFSGLEKYCTQRKIPKVVWICEDGTRITGKREYDKRTNCVLGFVLPLQNGVPQQKKYVADSEKNIVSYFENSTPKATIAYLIMAQPLAENVPPYCLCAFGTDNKFNHRDVLQRWEFMKGQAAKFNIKILGFSSDGDTRLLKAMRIASSFPIGNSNDNDWPWFSMNMKIEEIYVQDTTHILTKLRTRLLKFGIQLPIGKYFVSVSHLQQLIKECSKGLHQLTNWHLRAEDKMNFSAAEKICSDAVMVNLKKIPNSEATSNYLKLMRYMIGSFLDHNTSLQTKIYMSWYCTFFLRIWRSWIKKSKQYNTKDNFLSDNCYQCIEVNAHSLILLVILFRTNPQLQPNMFDITKFGSQACEKMFRILRSMTSTYSTVVNFSMKDILHRINRVKEVNDIMFELKDVFNFPRENKRGSSSKVELDFEFDIENIVLKSLKDASEDLGKLGIVKVQNKDWQNVEIYLKPNPTEVVEEEIDEGEIIVIDDEPNPDLMLTEPVKEKNYALKDFSASIKDADVTPDSPFVKIDFEGKQKIIKKSSLIWWLDEGNEKVSTDRLRRFFTSKKKISTPPRKKARKTQESTQELTDEDSEVEYMETDNENEFSLLEDNDKELDKIKIENERYYAVFYDMEYCIGRILETIENNTVYKMKFLKQELDKLIWPREDDIALIEKKFIFYGPINLIGSGPFSLNRTDLVTIKQKYKEIKRV